MCYKKAMGRGRLAWIFLGLVALGVLWPVLAGAVSCGDCCHRSSPCGGTTTTGFSLCCFHSVSTPPELPPVSFVAVDGSRLVAVDEIGGPPPSPHGILHVPLEILI